MSSNAFDEILGTVSTSLVGVGVFLTPIDYSLKILISVLTIVYLVYKIKNEHGKNK